MKKQLPILIFSSILILGLASAGYPEKPAPKATPPPPPPAAAAATEVPAVNPVSKARELIESGKPEAAVPLLQDHLKGKPGDMEAQFLLGKAYLHSSDEAPAGEIFEQIVNDHPEFSDRIAEVYFQAGNRLIRVQGKRQLGMQYLNRSLQLDGKREAEAALIFHDVGLEIAPENRWLAHRLLSLALELHPAYEEEELFEVGYAVESAFSAGKRSQAKKYFKKIAKEFPDTAYAREAQGRLEGF